MEEDEKKCDVYGVDTCEKVTPLMVRDAIIECFRQAHGEDSELGDEENEETSRVYCTSLVKKAFEDSKANFEDPTKEGIMFALKGLAEFSKNFRNQEMIQSHREEIMKLVAML